MSQITQVHRLTTLRCYGLCKFIEQQTLFLLIHNRIITYLVEKEQIDQVTAEEKGRKSPQKMN